MKMPKPLGPRVSEPDAMVDWVQENLTPIFDEEAPNKPKVTSLTMDWNERGAMVFYESSSALFSASFGCPRCRNSVPSGTEHRCGDRAKNPKKR